MVLSLFALAAPPMPAPIIGKLTLNGNGLDGYIIDVTNTAIGKTVSGDTISSLVTERGGFVVDLSKVDFEGPSRNYVGDTIKVSVRGLSDPQATVNIIPDPTPYYFDIAIVNTQTVYICPDGSQVVDLADCPEEEPEPEPVVDIETKVVSSEDGESASVEAYLGQVIEISLSDNKISNLLDKEIEYDGKGYDIHEEVSFKGVVLTSIDDEDFELDPYLVVEEGDLIYKYVFEDSLPFEDIHIEEPLDEVVFLGVKFEIIEALEDEITVRFGTEVDFLQGQTKTVNGKKIKVKVVMDDSVDVEVDGISETILEEDFEEVNGIEILVVSTSYQGYESGTKSTKLLIGEDVEATYKDGEYFELFKEDAETFKWIIDLPNSIGIVNQQEYKEIDDDEEYKAIGVGQGLSLPNNYINFNFKGLSDSDVVDITFKVDDGFLNVKGPEDAFAFGSDEYDEINVDENGIYDEDEVLITSDKVRIGDSDIYLELGSIKIGLLTIKLDMSDILYDGISYALEETNFLDYLGIIFKDPENAVEDQSGFKVLVPEERPEITIYIDSEAISVEPTEPIPVEPTEPEPVEPTEPTPVEPTKPPIVIPPVEPDVPVTPPVTPPVDDETSVFDNLIELIIIVLTAIGVTWRAGFLGLAKYYWKKGERVRAIKMLLTASKRAKEDYYKKKG